MDNLTHTLTGLMLSRAGLNRLHPRATLILLLSANAPDVDAFTIFRGAATYFQYHRWMTHAIVSLPVMALLTVAFARLFARKQPFPWLRGWMLAVIGIGSHLLLDSTNPYGIRLLLPFSDSWPSLSITSVLDIWIWAILILAAAAPALSRLVSSEIGAKSGTGRGWAVAALVLLTFYEGGRATLHAKAVQVQEDQMYNGETPRRALAYPGSINPLMWSGVVETGSFFVTQTVNLTQQPPSEQRIFYKPESSPAIEAAAGTPLFQALTKFSRALLWRTMPANDPEGATRVEASDLFFGFTATAIVDRTNQVISTHFYFGHP